MADKPLTNAGQSAREYLARGWPVVPIATGGKQPLVRWQPFQTRLPTPDEVEEWYRDWPDAGVGIVTGALSGLAVLDVDPRHGGDESLSALEGQYELLPYTIEAATGGGGRHLYFAYPGGHLRNRTALAPGIDLRAEGGLVIAPPSLHPSGGRYAWKPGHDPADTTVAPMPGWLIALARGQSGGPGHSVAHWRELVQKGVEEGARNSTIASLTGHLLWHGVDRHVALELLLAWNITRCRPPLDPEEVAATVDSIARTHARHRDDGGAQS